MPRPHYSIQTCSPELLIRPNVILKEGGQILIRIEPLFENRLQDPAYLFIVWQGYTQKAHNYIKYVIIDIMDVQINWAILLNINIKVSVHLIAAG